MKQKSMLEIWLIFLLLQALLTYPTFAADDPDFTQPGYVPDPDGNWAVDTDNPGQITKFSIAEKHVIQRQEKQNKVHPDQKEKMILFGDLHVHSTYSDDAFFFSLPLLHGTSGAFPPAAACDYARYISQLDFYALTDHGESYTPAHWKDNIESVRQCNAVSSDVGTPDLVAFMGWEWTQKGVTAKDHFGHHNIILRDLDDDGIPVRPIAADRAGSQMGYDPDWPILDRNNAGYYQSFIRFLEENRNLTDCEEGVHTKELPEVCFEVALTTADLFRKLDEWDIEAMVIPHGSTWGIYTPPNASWETKLVDKHHDPDRMRLIEVYSGHGNSEPYRDFRVRKFDDEGKPYCPEPQENYLPSCWQAGEIIRERCRETGETPAECEQRAIEARQNYVNLENRDGWRTVPGTGPGDWLDAGQARDIFLPAFNYRPMNSVQYALALRNFDDPENPLRYTWGFISSTDTHVARAGHGFKQYGRQANSEAVGGRNQYWHKRVFGKKDYPQPRSVPLDLSALSFGAAEIERATSFFYLGGIAAVHSTNRERQNIWNALKRKEVYATTGVRILLWFDMINATDKKGRNTIVPMGSATNSTKPPRFRVHAVGSFKQLPGCPEHIKNKLSQVRLEKLSAGECYHPSNERYLIDRIEVVRIRPQAYPDEPINKLIDDNWRVFQCPVDPSGCRIEFSDNEFNRDSLYYVRAIEQARPTVNGSNLRTEFNDQGEATSIAPCFGDYRTEERDDCLAMLGQRAWSSPIYVDFTTKTDKVSNKNRDLK